MGAMQNNKIKISQQVARLEYLRVTRSAALHAEDVLEDGDIEAGGHNLEDADAFSDTTSVGGGASVTTSVKSKSTLATRTSGRSKSSKGRRKQDRKLYSTKEGSTHEDLGLISELHETLSSIPGIISEVSVITRIFLDLNLLDTSITALQKLAQDLLTLGEEVKPNIWPAQQI